LHQPSMGIFRPNHSMNRTLPLRGIAGDFDR
jgi:hypothetical protein